MTSTLPVDRSFLVIDDSPHLRALINAYLRKAGYSQVAMAATGQEGIDLYRHARPDVVFLDFVMPLMDGLATLNEIRKIDPTAAVVMITSVSARETVVQLKEAGAFSYILKPFEESKFMEILGKTLAFIDGENVKE